MNRRQALTIGAAIVASAARNAANAEEAPLRVLSAAAVGPGLEPALEAFAQTRVKPLREYATGPEVRARVLAGEAPDLVIGPGPAMTELQQAGKLSTRPFPLGRVGVAVGVRKGAAQPVISTEAQFRRAVLGASTVIYSRGSTGLYVEGLLARLDLGAAKAERVRDGAGVVERLLSGRGDEIGLSARTELEVGALRGLVILGPLPGSLQSYTGYSVAAGVAARPAASDLLALLRSAEGRRMMDRAGVLPP